MRPQLLLLMLAFMATSCMRNRQSEDPLRSETVRGSDPSARRTLIAPASRAVANPDDLRVTPPRIEDPATLDDRAAPPERREERKERREERRAPEKPKLPSPFAPETPAPAPVNQAGNGSSSNADIAVARRIYDVAAAQFEKLVDFEATMTRREVVGKQESPTERVLFQYRKQPFSIYMKTIGDAGRGREVLYVEGQHDGKMHVVIGEGDGGLLMKPGSKMAFAPNNPIVANKSRQKITDAGFGNSLAKFGKLIALAENGTRQGAVKSLGNVQRTEYAYPLEGLELTLQPGDEASLPRGGKKTVFFDMKEGSSSYGFPVLIITHDETGREVEYYLFEKVKNPAGLTDADFHPERLQTRRR